MDMHFSSNVSHWVCLLAGFYLVLTGILLRDIMSEPAPAVSGSPARARMWRRAAGVGRRTVMIMVGLAAMVYGAFRMLS